MRQRRRAVVRFTAQQLAEALDLRPDLEAVGIRVVRPDGWTPHVELLLRGETISTTPEGAEPRRYTLEELQRAL